MLQKTIDTCVFVAYNGNINTNKEVNKALSEKEKKILETIAKTLPEMTEAEKMYLLGQAEGMAIMKKRERDGDEKAS